MNSLSKIFQNLLEKHTQNTKDFTLKEIIDTLGFNTFGMCFLILSIPSAMPFPAPGISTPFGLLNLLLAIQLLLGKKTPWIPKKALNIKINSLIVQKILSYIIKFLHKTEFLIHPRFSIFLNKYLIGTCILILSIIMALPIPLTNTLPALIILILAISIIESDGAWALTGLIAGILSILTYLYLFLFVIKLI